MSKEIEPKTHNIVLRRTFEYGVEIEAMTKREAMEKAKSLQVEKTKWVEKEKEYLHENKYRTEQQNKAMHKYFTLASDELNDKGITLTQLLEIIISKVQLMITPNVIKEQVWKPIQKALSGTESTRAIRKDGDIDKVYDSVNKALSEQLQCYIPFPSREMQHYEKIAQEQYVEPNTGD